MTTVPAQGEPTAAVTVGWLPKAKRSRPDKRMHHLFKRIQILPCVGSPMTLIVRKHLPNLQDEMQSLTRGARDHGIICSPTFSPARPSIEFGIDDKSQIR